VQCANFGLRFSDDVYALVILRDVATRVMTSATGDRSRARQAPEPENKYV
jgi:hypothetical protein